MTLLAALMVPGLRLLMLDEPFAGLDDSASAMSLRLSTRHSLQAPPCLSWIIPDRSTANYRTVRMARLCSRPREMCC